MIKRRGKAICERGLSCGWMNEKLVGLKYYMAVLAFFSFRKVRFMITTIFFVQVVDREVAWILFRFLGV